VAVPAYRLQPGTVVLGGARPPPQSRISQSSPVSGTYQMSLGPEMEEVQPARLVRARARGRRGRRVVRVVRRCILVVWERGKSGLGERSTGGEGR